MRPSSILVLALLLPLLAGPALGAPADDSRPIVPASEILAKIERGEPVEYDGVIIKGDLDLSGVDLPTKYVERSRSEIKDGLTEDVKFVESSISITDSVIRRDVNLGNAIFHESVDFSGTNFADESRFSGADFGGDGSFERVEFSGNAYFREVEFGGNADFQMAEFSGDADFDGVEFSGNAYFQMAEFSGDADFDGAKLNGRANFFRAKFNGYANFDGARFGGYARFEEAEFSSDGSFDEAKFGGYADFEEVEFGGDAYFEWAEFKYSDASFREAEFSGEANFGGAKFYEDLDLTGLEFETLAIEWDSINHLTCENGITYLALMKYLKDADQFDGANDCYYQYRRWKMRSKMAGDVERLHSTWRYLPVTLVLPGLIAVVTTSFSTSILVDILAWLSCGYGVKPLRPLAFGLFVVVACAVYYWERDAIRRLKGGEGDGESDRANFWDAFYFSMMTFTTVGYGDWYPLDEYRRMVMFEGIFGWLLLSLFLVTLARVMIP